MLFSAWPLDYLLFSLSKKHPHHSSPVQCAWEMPDRSSFGSHAALAIRSHTCTYTCSLTLVHRRTQDLFVCTIKSSIQMLSSDWGSWEGVQRKKITPEFKERYVILHPSPSPVLPHEKLCRALLHLADCADGCHGCTELWICEAFLCFIVPIIHCTNTHKTQPFLISFLMRHTQTFMNFG